MNPAVDAPENRTTDGYLDAYFHLPPEIADTPAGPVVKSIRESWRRLELERVAREKDRTLTPEAHLLKLDERARQLGRQVEAAAIDGLRAVVRETEAIDRQKQALFAVPGNAAELRAMFRGMSTEERDQVIEQDMQHGAPMVRALCDPDSPPYLCGFVNNLPRDALRQRYLEQKAPAILEAEARVTQMHDAVKNARDMFGRHVARAIDQAKVGEIAANRVGADGEVA